MSSGTWAQRVDIAFKVCNKGLYSSPSGLEMSSGKSIPGNHLQVYSRWGWSEPLSTKENKMPLSIVIIMFPEFCSLLSPHLVTSKTWIICEYMRDGCPQRDSQLKTLILPSEFLGWVQSLKAGGNTSEVLTVRKHLRKRWPTFAICIQNFWNMTQVK